MIFLHSLKADFPIEITDEGIVICASSKHPLNARLSIDVTEEGIDICFNDEHPMNAELPINVIDGGIATLFNSVLFSKHSSGTFFSFNNKK